MSNCQRERHSFRCDRIDSVLWEFSIGTDKDKDAEFDSRDEPGTVLEEGSLLPQINVHETCGLHRKGNVQSVEQQISQVAGTRSIDMIRDVAEVGWKKWRDIDIISCTVIVRRAIGNCISLGSSEGAASWVKEWQVESPVAFLIPLLLLLLLLSCSVHDVIISNVNIVRLFRDALIFKHLGTSSLFPSCGDTFLLTSMPSFAASQGLGPWQLPELLLMFLGACWRFPPDKEECGGLLFVSLSFSWSRHMIGHRLHRFPFAECVEEGCRRGKIFKIPNLWLLKICKSNYVNQKRHK